MMAFLADNVVLPPRAMSPGPLQFVLPQTARSVHVTPDQHNRRPPLGISDVARPEFKSPAYRRVLEQLERFARAERAPILIEGESGTGKTLIARRLHKLSSRAAAPFQYIVLSAVDDSLVGSELFGHVTGAFTDARYNRAGLFASAAGGTLFLDEIGKASHAVQQKLLHAVECGEIRPIGSDRDVRVDVRIVAASNVSLAHLAAKDRFLPDLYARLNSFRIELPPLRQRRDDIPILVDHFVRFRSVEAGYEHPPLVDSALLEALQNAPWPNNLRQLDGTIFRLLVDAQGARELRLTHCRDDLAYLRDLVVEDQPLSARHAEDAIVRAGGSVSGAARLLGVNRTTVQRARKRRLVADDLPVRQNDRCSTPPDAAQQDRQHEVTVA
jgi:DNA-binding NtrC family response regulator